MAFALHNANDITVQEEVTMIVDETKELSMTMRIKASVKERAMKMADEDNRSLANYIETLIEQDWARRHRKSPSL
jgi:predicted HicB family RNase H-like nuclease